MFLFLYNLQIDIKFDKILAIPSFRQKQNIDFVDIRQIVSPPMKIRLMVTKPQKLYSAWKTGLWTCVLCPYYA